ncbi:MAG: YfiR family protein [Chitinophagaceae bacterium]|nr:YfiR family protein [Chitinophagaceae bacterium]
MSILTIYIHHRLKIPLLICGILLLCSQAPSTREYQIKAVFLFNFTQFIEWPSHSFENAQSPLIIGVLGKDPFGNSLGDAVNNEKVNGHPLVVRRYSSPEEIEDCQILFINLHDPDKVVKIIARLKGKSILTVSDDNNFLKQGGIVRFFTRDNKIQLQINPEAAKSADLIISSKLLRLAEIVIPKTVK